MNRLPPTREDGEVRELTDADFKRMKPLREIDLAVVEAARNRGGRPKAEAPKVHIGFCLAADIVSAIKATGKGYAARVERVLRDALEPGKS